MIAFIVAALAAVGVLFGLDDELSPGSVEWWLATVLGGAGVIALVVFGVYAWRLARLSARFQDKLTISASTLFVPGRAFGIDDVRVPVGKIIRLERVNVTRTPPRLLVYTKAEKEPVAVVDAALLGNGEAFESICTRLSDKVGVEVEKSSTT